MNWLDVMDKIKESKEETVKTEDAKLVISKLASLYSMVFDNNLELTARNKSLFETLQYSSKLINKKELTEDIQSDILDEQNN